METTSIRQTWRLDAASTHQEHRCCLCWRHPTPRGWAKLGRCSQGWTSRKGIPACRRRWGRRRNFHCERQYLTLQSKVSSCPPVRQIQLPDFFGGGLGYSNTKNAALACELGGLSTQSGVVRSDFRFPSQLPSQQRHSQHEKSVFFFLFFVVFCESAYLTSTQITALICKR